MIIPLYLVFTPLIHYIITSIVKIRNNIVNFVFPTIYLVLLTYLIIDTRGLLRGYTLSTLPILGNLHTSLILVTDYLSLVFLSLILIYYFFITINMTHREKLVLISMLTINALTLDLLLSMMIFLIITLYLTIIKGNTKIIKYSMVFTILFLLGYIFTNTFNIGLLVFLNRFRYLPEELLGLGTYLYLLGYLYLLFLPIGFQPIIRKTVIDPDDKFFIIFYALPILFRLLPILGLLYNDTFYRIYSYFLLALASVNMLHYTISYLSGRKLDDIEAYEYSGLFLLLCIASPSSLQVALLAITLYFIHDIIASVSKHLEKYVILSRLGVFPLPGFLVKMYFFATLYSYLGVLALIIPLLTFLFMIFASIQLMSQAPLLDKRFFSISIIVSIILILVIDVYGLTASTLFKLPDYQRIVFGV